jgi:hypothetical protein
MTPISRRIFDSALPEGEIWRTKPGEDLDAIFDGMAENFESTRAKAAEVANTRNPEKTPLLSDLEIDFGVFPDSSLTTAIRRAYLAQVQGQRGTTCSWEFLENKLRAMGFDVRVYPNDPPIDVKTVMESVAYDSELIVNGDVIVSQRKDYDITCEHDDATEFTATCEHDDATEFEVTADSFRGMFRTPYQYPYPIGMTRLPYVFFVAQSIVGNERFEDWNMERATTLAWTAGGDSVLSKDTSAKKDGIRSLCVTASATLLDPIGPYAEQLLSIAAAGSRTVRVTVWATTHRKAALVVCNKDGEWDEAGIVLSADSPAAEELEYTATNGVSGVRLYLTSAHPENITEGDSAWFDDLRCEGLVVERALVPEELRLSLRKAILKYKPMRAWGALLVEYTVGELPLEEREVLLTTTGRRLRSTDPSNIVVNPTTNMLGVQRGSGGALIEEDKKITNQDDQTQVVRGLEDTDITLDAAANFDVPKLFRVRNATEYLCTVYLDSGAILCLIYPGGEASIILVDDSTSDGEWSVVGYGAQQGFETVNTDLAATVEKAVNVYTIPDGYDALVDYRWFFVAEDHTKLSGQLTARVVNGVLEQWPSEDVGNSGIEVEALLDGQELTFSATADVSGAIVLYRYDLPTVKTVTAVTTDLSYLPATLGNVAEAIAETQPIEVSVVYSDTSVDSTAVVPSGAVITSVRVLPTVVFNGTTPVVVVKAVGTATVTLATVSGAQLKSTANVIGFELQQAIASDSIIRVEVTADGSTMGAVDAIVAFVTPQSDP